MNRLRAALLPVVATVLVLAVVGLCAYLVTIAVTTPGFYQ